ncbi:MAG: single-stranded DNA-binding protein, partial [Chloroflexota bacterium]
MQYITQHVIDARLLWGVANTEGYSAHDHHKGIAKRIKIMAGYEQCTIVGNVGRDPEMRYLQSGANVTSFSVAVTTRWTDRNTNERREKTNWYNVSCWGRLAEIANQYVTKGTQIMVVGTVSARAWSGQDGEARAS